MTLDFTEVSIPYKFIPRSCVQPIPRETALKGQNGQVLFMSRWRNGKTEVAMIDEQAIRLKAGLFNELINEYREENDLGREVMIDLFAVDLKIMKRFFEQDPDFSVGNSLHDYCKLMEIGWKYQIESMYISAAHFFNNFEMLKIPRDSALHTPEILREVMKAIRYRVSATKQAQCLDLILDYELDSFPRAGAFLTNAFYLKEERGFEHELHFHSNLLNTENDNSIKLNCCTHPRPFIINYKKPPMYCSSCQKVLCARCQRTRCHSRLLSFVQASFYIRVYKTKCRTPKTTRREYEALGDIFPNPNFETLEDCVIFVSNLSSLEI